MPLTLEERERIAYANGDVETAALLANIIDMRDELQSEDAECDADRVHDALAVIGEA